MLLQLEISPVNLSHFFGRVDRVRDEPMPANELGTAVPSFQISSRTRLRDELG